MNGTYNKAERTMGKKLRQSAEMQGCTMRLFRVCNYMPETTVLAHGKKDKGMGYKSDDKDACYACSACHDVLDGRVPMPLWLTYESVWESFYAGVERTHKIMRLNGVI